MIPNIIYRISGRESKNLTKTLVTTQNILNLKINELESEQALSAAWAKRVTLLEKATRYYENQKAELEAEIKKHKIKYETEKTLKEQAQQEVKNAAIAVEQAHQTVFDVNQALASKNADLNNMILSVSQLEQRLKDLSKPKTVKDKVSQMRKKWH